ncbi:MAG: hypothetical protein ACRC5R_01555 [Mycoplasmatales bacterium]
MQFLISSIFIILLTNLLIYFNSQIISKVFKIKSIYIYVFLVSIFLLPNILFFNFIIVIATLFSLYIVLIKKGKVNFKIKKIIIYLLISYTIIYGYDIFITKSISITGIIDIFDSYSFAFLSRHFIIFLTAILIADELCIKYFKDRYEAKVILISSIIFGISFFTYVPTFTSITLRSDNLQLLTIVFIFLPLLCNFDLNDSKKKISFVIIFLISLMFGFECFILLSMYLFIILIDGMKNRKKAIMIVTFLSFVIFVFGSGVMYLYYSITTNLPSFYQLETLEISSSFYPTGFIMENIGLLILVIFSIKKIIVDKDEAFYKFIYMFLIFGNPIFWKFLSTYSIGFNMDYLIIITSLSFSYLINVNGFLKVYDLYFKNIFKEFSFLVVIIILFLIVF